MDTSAADLLDAISIDETDIIAPTKRRAQKRKKESVTIKESVEDRISKTSTATRQPVGFGSKTSLAFQALKNMILDESVDADSSRRTTITSVYGDIDLADFTDDDDDYDDEDEDDDDIIRLSDSIKDSKLELSSNEEFFARLTVPRVESIVKDDDEEDYGLFGRFVNPLAYGSDESLTISDEKKKQEEKESVQIIEEIEEEEEDVAFSFEEFPSEELEIDSFIDLVVDEGPIVQIIDENENQLQEFTTNALDLIIKQSDFEDRKQVIRRQALEQRMRAEEMINSFLYNLIDKTVNYLESADPKTVLRHNLDKMKLCDELIKKLNEWEFEKHLRHYMIRKFNEFARRNSLNTSFLPDNPDRILEQSQKYEKVLNKLDNLLGVENVCITKLNNKKPALQNEINEMEMKLQNNTNAFHDLIRNTVTLNRSEHLQQIINYKLNEMDLVHKELSEMRSTLILKSHLLASFLESYRELQNIAPNLTLTRYEAFKHENLTLIVKNEERQVDVTKYRSSVNKKLHLLAHLRDKHSMMKRDVQIQMQNYKDLVEKRHEARSILYKQKLKRLSLTQTISNIVPTMGLMHRPTLLRDYDVTVMKIAATQTRNSVLKAKLHIYSKRVGNIEDKLRDLSF